jgi:hypothetical protein
MDEATEILMMPEPQDTAVWRVFGTDPGARAIGGAERVRPKMASAKSEPLRLGDVLRRARELHAEVVQGRVRPEALDAFLAATGTPAHPRAKCAAAVEETVRGLRRTLARAALADPLVDDDAVRRADFLYPGVRQLMDALRKRGARRELPRLARPAPVTALTQTDDVTAVLSPALDDELEATMAALLARPPLLALDIAEARFAANGADEAARQLRALRARLQARTVPAGTLEELRAVVRRFAVGLLPR